MNTAASNQAALNQNQAQLERARFSELLEETFALPAQQESAHRLPSFYPNYHRVRMSVSPAQSYSSDASVMLKLKADRYTLSVT